MSVIRLLSVLVFSSLLLPIAVGVSQGSDDAVLRPVERLTFDTDPGAQDFLNWSHPIPADANTVLLSGRLIAATWTSAQNPTVGLALGDPDNYQRLQVRYAAVALTKRFTMEVREVVARNAKKTWSSRSDTELSDGFTFLLRWNQEGTIYLYSGNAGWQSFRFPHQVRVIDLFCTNGIFAIDSLEFYEAGRTGGQDPGT